MKPYRGIAFIALALLALSTAGQANVLQVDDVRAGGIIVFEKNGFTARLTGLVVPGLEHRLGLEIWDFIKREIHGQRVRVFTWTTNNTAAGIVYDEAGFPFVTIEYGAIGHEKGTVKNLNEILLQKGYARVDEKQLPEDRQHYHDLQKQAQASQVGIWGK